MSKSRRRRPACRLIAIAWTICLTLGLGSTTAHAKGEYARSGIYASFLGVVGIPTWQNQLQSQEAAALPGAIPPELSVSGGLDMRLGYRFHERVSAEMKFDWIAAYGISQAGVQTSQASNWSYMVSAKLFLLTDAIQPYALLGMGAYHLDYVLPGTATTIDGTSFSPVFAGGLDYYIDWRWGLSAEVGYVIGTRQLNDLNRVSVSFGAFYRF